jgi:hypothetical protein
MNKIKNAHKVNTADRYAPADFFVRPNEVDT